MHIECPPECQHPASLMPLRAEYITYEFESELIKYPGYFDLIPQLSRFCSVLLLQGHVWRLRNLHESPFVLSNLVSLTISPCRMMTESQELSYLKFLLLCFTKCERLRELTFSPASVVFRGSKTGIPEFLDQVQNLNQFQHLSMVDYDIECLMTWLLMFSHAAPRNLTYLKLKAFSRREWVAKNVHILSRFENLGTLYLEFPTQIEQDLKCLLQFISDYSSIKHVSLVYGEEEPDDDIDDEEEELTYSTLETLTRRLEDFSLSHDLSGIFTETASSMSFIGATKVEFSLNFESQGAFDGFLRTLIRASCMDIVLIATIEDAHDDTRADKFLYLLSEMPESTELVSLAIVLPLWYRCDTTITNCSVELHMGRILNKFPKLKFLDVPYSDAESLHSAFRFMKRLQTLTSRI